MNKNNRYCCIIVPNDISIECNYFEIELEVKDLKKIINDINKELNYDFNYKSAIINEKYGILLNEISDLENQYVQKLTGKNKCGRYLLISHMANLENFLKRSKDLQYYENMKTISHNSSLCKNMIMLCMEYILQIN